MQEIFLRHKNDNINIIIFVKCNFICVHTFLQATRTEAIYKYSNLDLYTYIITDYKSTQRTYIHL